MPNTYDAVVGNPPYVRFESRSPEERTAIHDVLFQRSADHEVAFPDFTGKADLWVFFVADAMPSWRTAAGWASYSRSKSNDLRTDPGPL
jgi:hypothetical protein